MAFGSDVERLQLPLPFGIMWCEWLSYIFYGTITLLSYFCREDFILL